MSLYSIEVKSLGNGKVSLTTTCSMCKEKSELVVDSVSFFAWRGGKFVQDAFPELTADEREKLISGTCPSCWEEMFGE
jgi:hypothetical protein